MLSDASRAGETAIDFAMPPGATDCHVHIIPDPGQFPFANDRAYTPPVSTPEQLCAVHQALHLDRTVVVTPSVYGTDNAAMLYGLRRLGARRARGVAILDDGIGTAALNAMQEAGVRGSRLNLETNGVLDPAMAARRLLAAQAQVGDRPWHLEMYARLPVIAALGPVLGSLRIPVVLEHFAGARLSAGGGLDGLDTVLSLLRSGRIYVLLSGAYLVSAGRPDCADVAPLARAMIAANPERILWGTNWPHPTSRPPKRRKPTEVTPDVAIDDGALLDQLAVWAPEASVRRGILVDNPGRLYDF